MSLVLAVDDSKPMLAMLSKCLSDGGHQVVKAVDGIEALSQLRKHNPDIVITDLNLPNMDGLEFIEEARKDNAGQGLPILLLTTETADALKQRAREVKATGWITKPFDPDQILGLVRQLA